MQNQKERRQVSYACIIVFCVVFTEIRSLQALLIQSLYE